MSDPVMSDRASEEDPPSSSASFLLPSSFPFFACRLHFRPGEEHVRRRLEVMDLLRTDPSKLRAADVAVSLRSGGVPVLTCSFTDVPDAAQCALAEAMCLSDSPPTPERRLEIALEALRDIAAKRRGQSVFRTRQRARDALHALGEDGRDARRVLGRFPLWKEVAVGEEPLRFDPATDCWFAPSFVESIVMLTRREPEEWSAWHPRGEHP